MIWVVIFFLLSSIFRLSNLNLIEFKSDEATTVYQIVQFFDQPYLIQRGLISGTGVYNFPLFSYLMIGLGIWSQDPQFLSGIIALINSLLVGIFFLFVKRYYDFITALVASLLLAFSPWAILFSRKIWAQDLIFLFLIPVLYLLHELILKKNTKVVLPLFLLLVLLAQLHGSGLFILAITIVVLLILRIRVDPKKAILGALIGLIPILPYLIFQINSNPACPDCEAFVKYQQSVRSFDSLNFLRPFQIISGLGFHFVLGRSYVDFIATYPQVDQFKYIFATAIPVTLAGMLLIIKERKYLYLVIYFVAIPFLYFITKTQSYMHYFVMIIPVSILLFAKAVTSAFTTAHIKFLKASIIVYFLIFLISNIIFTTYFYNFIGSKKDIEGDYGPVYSLTKEFVEKETRIYQHLPHYKELRSFSYIYAQSKDFHTKLGEFLLMEGNDEKE